MSLIVKEVMALIKRPSARAASKSKINNPYHGIRSRKIAQVSVKRLDSLRGFNAFLMDFPAVAEFLPSQICSDLNAHLNVASKKRKPGENLQISVQQVMMLHLRL